MKLLTEKNVCRLLRLEKKELKQHIEDGMPCLRVGKKHRFIKKEVAGWYQKHAPEQVAQEVAFLDEKGQTIDAYVRVEEIASFLRIKPTVIDSLCQKGLPHVTVGYKTFFLVEQVVEYLRPHATLPKEQPNVVKGFFVAELPKVTKINDILHIQFTEKKAGFCYFKVMYNGEERLTKMNGNSIVKTALLIVRSYTTTKATKLYVDIDPLPGFEQDMDTLFSPKKRKFSKQIYEMFTSLQEECYFDMSDRYQSYLQEYEKRQLVLATSSV